VVAVDSKADLIAHFAEDYVTKPYDYAELLARMLNLNPRTCILICSGYPFDLASLPVTFRQQIGFLQKPFTPKMLANAVEQLLAARGGARPA